MYSLGLFPFDFLVDWVGGVSEDGFSVWKRVGCGESLALE